MQVVADLAKLSLGREDHYLREIAEIREEYLSGHGESPGRWYGAGAAALGQDGIASTEAFRRIFEGAPPRDRGAAGPPAREEPRAELGFGAAAGQGRGRGVRARW